MGNSESHTPPSTSQTYRHAGHASRVQTFPPSNQSQTFTAYKGLKNRAGLNHCFLNVVIQSLWHIRSFRERFISLDYTHVHRASPCVFCALRTIFNHFEFSDELIIPPDSLRQAMHELSLNHEKFLWGDMADAEEALDEVLHWLHCDQVGVQITEKSRDVGCSPPCISHAVFSLELADIKKCLVCGGQSNPETSSSFLYRVYVAELLAAANGISSSNNHRSRKHRSWGGLGHALKQVSTATAFSCPVENSKCKGRAVLHRHLLSRPAVFTMMLAWPVSAPSRTQITTIFSLLGGMLTVEDFLHATPSPPPYFLRGMICYYGRHYLSFFYSDLYRQWIIFDDTRVQRVGTWQQLVDRCVKGKLQPVVLFFEGTDQAKASVLLAKSMQAGWVQKEREERRKDQEYLDCKHMTDDGTAEDFVVPYAALTSSTASSSSSSSSSSLEDMVVEGAVVTAPAVALGGGAVTGFAGGRGEGPAAVAAAAAAKAAARLEAVAAAAQEVETKEAPEALEGGDEGDGVADYVKVQWPDHDSSFGGFATPKSSRMRFQSWEKLPTATLPPTAASSAASSILEPATAATSTMIKTTVDAANTTVTSTNTTTNSNTTTTFSSSIATTTSPSTTTTATAAAAAAVATQGRTSSADILATASGPGTKGWAVGGGANESMYTTTYRAAFPSPTPPVAFQTSAQQLHSAQARKLVNWLCPSCNRKSHQHASSATPWKCPTCCYESPLHHSSNSGQGRLQAFQEKLQ